jgi:putative addiction module component (TIGR02574 family)
MNIHNLSASEKILLAEELWESVRAEADNAELPESHRLELDRRLAQFEIDEDVGDDWESVKRRIVAE